MKAKLIIRDFEINFAVFPVIFILITYGMNFIYIYYLLSLINEIHA